jgi:HAE1 family hydrophobic/amphiphilic exporter-1
VRAIVKWATSNAPAMNTLMIGVMIVGAISFMSMRREVFPQFDLEMILVTVPYPGASPEEVEDGICLKIEEAARSIDGVKRLTSVAQEGAGYMIIELEAFVDPKETLDEVRSQMDRITSFPRLAEDPEVEQLSFEETAIRVAVLGPDRTDEASELELRAIVEQVRDELLALPSISKAVVVGSRKFQIDIELSEDSLREYGLTLLEVADTVRAQNIELPGGSIKSTTQEILLRGKDKQLSGSEIAKIPLVTKSNVAALTIADVGQVRDAFEDVSSISRINNRPGITVSVDRSKTEDILKIVDEVHAYRDTKVMPPGYELLTWFDQSRDVRDRMELLTRNGLQGLVLVFVMLAIFLDLRLAFWVALGIPISILGAGAVLIYMGQTLNMLSMFAFLMALGIVVDDAIVIGENIYAHQQRGVPALKAAIDGTVEVMPSVTASVSTTIIAFSPLLFVSGVMGKFIAVMPVAVIAMLVISLIESMIILPCHLAHPRPPRKDSASWAKDVWAAMETKTALMKWTLGPPVVFLAMIAERMAYPFQRFADLFHKISAQSNRLMEAFVERFYLPALRYSIRHAGLVICTAYSLMFVSIGVVNTGFIPYEVFPKMDAYLIEANITYPDGTPEEITNAASQRIERALAEVNEELSGDGESLVRTVRRSVGEVRDISMIGPEGLSLGSHVAKVDAELIESSRRTITSQGIIEKWRQRAGEFPGSESITFGSPEMGPGGTPIEFRLLSTRENMSRLEAAVEKCKAKLTEFPGVVDIRDDSRPGKWEFQLSIKDKAKSLGVTLDLLARTVRAAYYGEEVMRLQRGRHEVKLMVRYPPDERRDLASFEDIRVRVDRDTEYPLTELADVQIQRGYAEISRIDQKRAIAVLADIDDPDVKSGNVVAALQKEFIPKLLAEYPGVTVLWEGQEEQTNESVKSLVRGLVIALLAMFVLLTLEFRSYVQPAIIIAVIPFGIVGAIWGHALMGLTLTIFTMFGLVALTGVVVNDSIVLIDFINRRMQAGDELVEALMTAGRRRFRPVILTSITTIAGLTPMLMETSFQAQFLIPLAATMVFGLLLATVMVLILVPLFYLIYQRTVHGRRLAADPSDSLREDNTRPRGLPSLEPDSGEPQTV